MKILVVVDMQNDFISGALGSEEAKKIVPNVVQKIKSFVGMIAATYDNHHENYLETQEGKNLPVIHCVEGEEGWKIADPIREALSNRVNTDSELEVFFKPTFGSVELADWLTQIDRKEKIDEVVLVGLCTDICVISNAMLIKAFMPEVKITVDASCCAGVTPESHKNALEAMKMCQINIEGV